GISLFHDLSNSISSIFMSVEIGNDKFNYIVPEYFKNEVFIIMKGRKKEEKYMNRFLFKA
ncbi:unnamed protein product, partial [marine sediment metagenome]